MSIKLALSEERLKILSECMQNYDVGADTDEWPNNIISRFTSVYNDGSISKHNIPLQHEIDPDELKLYHKLSTEIANIMRVKKSMGCGYFGNTKITVLDSFQEPVDIFLHRPNIINIGFNIGLQSTSEYTTEIGDEIKQAIADYVNQLDIGDKISLNKIYVPAGLYGNLNSMTYEISSIKIVANDQELGGDYRLAFNEVAYCDSDNIEINISGGD